MRLPHIMLAFLIMIIWGIQFVMIHVAAAAIPPFLLCCLRFFFTSIPLIFFIERPKMPFKLILFYGWFTFAAQYALFFMAMHLGMPAGLAALVYQVQILINIGLAYLFFNERITLIQFAGVVIAFLGFAIVGFHLDDKATLLGFFLTILSTVFWAFGNMASKKAGKVNMIALVVWGNFVSVPPMLIMTGLLESPAEMLYAWHHLSWLTVIAVAYIVYFSTLIAFSLWSWLLSLYPVTTVVPFMLLVPLISMLIAFFTLGETLPIWKLDAAAVVIGGLCIYFFGRQLVSGIASRLNR